MAHRVTLIPGDGLGPEPAEATRRVREVIAESTHTTYDLGGSTGTAGHADAITERPGVTAAAAP